MKFIFFPILFSLAISGCTLFGDDDEPADIQFSVENVNSDEIFILINDSKSRYEITEEDFTGSENNSFPGTTKTYGTATDGSINIIFSFHNQSIELASGEFALELKEDWLWGVNFLVASAEFNPLTSCLGCQSYKSFKLQPEALSNTDEVPDSLYVVFGGNYISEPVVH